MFKNYIKYINDKNIRENTIKYWNTDKYKYMKINNKQNYKSSLNNNQNNELSIIIFDIFIKYNFKNIKILEIGCGNCITSKIIIDKLQKFNITWYATDLIDYKLCGLYNIIINSVDAIKYYGDDSDILIIIIGIPFINYFDFKEQHYIGYYDYYAIYDYIEISKNKKNKYIILVGDFLIDFSEDLYNFLMTHNNLLLKEKIQLKSDNYSNRTVYLFEII
jgi:hypothetical protein